jgi:carbon-monoxide dehydrogenase medium subunit
MIPPVFDYVAPKSVADAVALLQQHGPDASILAGGHSLLPLLKLRLASPRVVVDINRIPGLEYIREADGTLRIGTLTREADLEHSDLLKSKYPILVDTSRVIADPLVRNLATVGGNLAHADPANDHPATMLALEAEVVATGPNGERRIPITSFFTGLFATALGPGEILTEIRVPVPPPRSGGAYVKLERKVGDFATAAVAAQVTLGRGGECEKVGIGLTNVGMVPTKAKKAEEFLRGRRPDPAAIQEAGRLAAGEAKPKSDNRGPAEYKRELVRVLTARALTRAVERAGGGR